jgi:hypothetical protein
MHSADQRSGNEKAAEPRRQEPDDWPCFGTEYPQANISNSMGDPVPAATSEDISCKSEKQALRRFEYSIRGLRTRPQAHQGALMIARSRWRADSGSRLREPRGTETNLDTTRGRPGRLNGSLML